MNYQLDYNTSSTSYNNNFLRVISPSAYFPQNGIIWNQPNTTISFVNNSYYTVSGAPIQPNYFIDNIGSWAGQTIPPYGEIQQIKTYTYLNSSFASNVGVGNTFTLTSANVDLTGLYITTTSNTYLVNSFDLSTLNGTISTVFNNELANSPVYVRTITLFNPLTYNLLNNSYYQILPVSGDNWVPLFFNGSNLSLQQETCYEIELKNLILPNITLNTVSGGLPVYYPYVYVELTVKSSPSLNTIYSNNPNANKALFRCVVSDNTAPTISPFVRLRSDGIKQKIKFKPNDNLHFSVKMPSGEYFSTITTDFYSPIEPNPLVQISAIFEIKRMS